MKTLLSFFALLAVSASSQAGSPFPTSPDEQLTPGALCAHPTSKRYPEAIPYCSRNVASETKREIMEAYDSRLGYRITSMQRSKFKIDHYIPLCAGGSNAVDNLWPQHESVYAVTDPLEPVVCEKMSKGKLLQADAIRLIKRAKADLAEVPSVIRYVENL